MPDDFDVAVKALWVFIGVIVVTLLLLVSVTELHVSVDGRDYRVHLGRPLPPPSPAREVAP